MKKELKSVYIEIISKCNERCIYCYNEKIIEDLLVMPLTKILKIIDECSELGVESIAISGGEPLLHPDVMTVLDYAIQRKLKVTLISNCTLISERMAAKFSDKEIDIQLTLDSGIEEVHEKSRGNGTFKAQGKAIKNLLSAGFPGSFTLRCNLWIGNSGKESINSVIDYARQYSIHHINFATTHATEIFHDVIIDDEQFESLTSYIDDLNEQNEDLEILYGDGQVEWGCPLITDKSDGDLNCGFRIAPDLSVFPCQSFSSKEFVIGNLKMESLHEVIIGDKFSDFLNLLRLRGSFISECQECVCKSVCNAGCPARAYQNTHNIISISGGCGRRKKAYRNILNEALHYNI